MFYAAACSGSCGFPHEQIPPSDRSSSSLGGNVTPNPSGHTQLGVLLMGRMRERIWVSLGIVMDFKSHPNLTSIFLFPSPHRNADHHAGGHLDLRIGRQRTPAPATSWTHSTPSARTEPSRAPALRFRS